MCHNLRLSGSIFQIRHIATLNFLEIKYKPINDDEAAPGTIIGKVLACGSAGIHLNEEAVKLSLAM